MGLCLCNFTYMDYDWTKAADESGNCNLFVFIYLITECAGGLGCVWCGGV